MDVATPCRLQQAHQRQRKEWDRIGRRLKLLTGKRSSDLLLHDPLLQPPFAAHPRQRMSGCQQLPMPMVRKQSTQIRRNHPNRSAKCPAPNDPLELLVVGQQLQMHRPPGRRHVQLQDPASSSQPRQQIEEYVYFYPVHYYEMDHWPPHAKQEPSLVVDARFMAELLDELLLNAGNPI
ncbi:uncharacterized protein LOC122625058 [Drosophila teissieri]|uniref:uncharacterized protein LOC122625058 n=1 Tax=Drosophila teissieri TaxID=7243 RepID=UPI001CBA2D32|nr:uncharacterized protein LOC122625058 [Drosophila teissieri]